MATELWAYKSQ